MAIISSHILDSVHGCSASGIRVQCQKVFNSNGDQIVFVATASAHRSDAFNSCEYIVDFLKTRAPFWKKEEYKSRVSWVQARSSDEDSLNKWEEVAN